MRNKITSVAKAAKAEKKHLNCFASKKAFEEIFFSVVSKLKWRQAEVRASILGKAFKLLS